ncbi:MAG: hypothetical protein WBZ36_17145 [Candidatus Nitrosopolaris sp.]
MEMIDEIVWILTGFTSTLFSMEIAWSLAKRQTRKVPIATAKSIRLLQPRQER